MKKAPAVFIGHGSPINVIEENNFNKEILALGEKISKHRPKAILCLSAHYQTDGTNIDASKFPKTIHDFSGFPETHYQMNYPSPGNPELALEISQLIDGTVVTNWGLDHGAWNILWHLFPAANIPVVMMSLNYNLSFEEHFNLGKKLGILRDDGVMILGSGNIVHSFKGIRFHSDAEADPQAIRFEKYTKDKITQKDFASLVKFDSKIYEDAKFSVNSAEHYLPLLYILGASQKSEKELIFNDEIVFSTLSMMSVAFGI
jgi:4,5-DOPA dioxygenase extradiol